MYMAFLDPNFDPRIFDSLSLLALLSTKKRQGGADDMVGPPLAGPLAPRTGPPFDSQWIDDRYSIQQRGGEEHEEHRKGDMDSAFIKWTHMGITVTLAIFLFGQYEKAQDWARTIAVNSEKIAELREAHSRQEQTLRDANNHIELLEAEIKVLRERLIDHSSYDDRRFRALSPLGTDPAQQQRYRNNSGTTNGR